MTDSAPVPRYTTGATAAVVGFGPRPGEVDRDADRGARRMVALAYLRALDVPYAPTVGRYRGSRPEPGVILYGPDAHAVARTLGRALSQESVYCQSGGIAALYYLTTGDRTPLGAVREGPDPAGYGETTVTNPDGSETVFHAAESSRPSFRDGCGAPDDT